MKQMSLIEMDGFLKGKRIPRDLKVNETNAEYLVRKFGELESKIALLEVQLKLSEAAERAWESSMMQACGEDGPKSVADKFAELEARCAALAAEKEKFAVECAATKIAIAYLKSGRQDFSLNTPSTDAFLAEVRASAIPDEATERDLFEEWVMEKIFISKTTLEGLRTDDGYRNSTLSGTDYNGMWSQWKAIRAAQLRQEAAQ